MYTHGAGRLAERIAESFTALEWLHLDLVAAVCVGLTWWIAHVLNWPIYPDYETSILGSAARAAGLAAVVVALLVCVTVATLLGARLRYEIGLFGWSVGLAALAARGGSVSQTLRSAANPHLYVTLLIETAVLWGIALFGWVYVRLLCRAGWIAPESGAAEAEILKPNPAQHILAALVQATVMGLLVVVLAQSESKKQVMAAVAIASVLGGIAAHQSFPVRPSVAIWTGPYIVAAVGYACAIKAPGRWSIGAPASALAAASPLDYASLGTSGALLGYWISRIWKKDPPEMDVPDGKAVEEDQPASGSVAGL